MAGVQIFLAERTIIPRRLTKSQNVTVFRAKRNGRQSIRCVRIRGGDARFASGGAVEVKMPGEKIFQEAFPKLKVLEIRALQGNLLEQSYHLCTKCFKNTGKITAERKTGTDFKCAECKYIWTIAVA